MLEVVRLGLVKESRETRVVRCFADEAVKVAPDSELPDFA